MTVYLCVYVSVCACVYLCVGVIRSLIHLELKFVDSLKLTLFCGVQLLLVFRLFVWGTQIILPHFFFSCPEIICPVSHGYAFFSFSISLIEKILPFFLHLKQNANICKENWVKFFVACFCPTQQMNCRNGGAVSRTERLTAACFFVVFQSKRKVR